MMQRRCQISLLAGYSLTLFSLLSCTQAIEFRRQIYVAAFTENVPQFGDIVDTGCTDSAGIPLSNVSYMIVNGRNSQIFKINPVSGQISWKMNQTLLDYEATPFYLFNIRCTDNLAPITLNTATAMVNVSVLPVNEFLPEISPGFLTVVTQENAPTGTLLVSTQRGALRQYSVTDRDHGPDAVITYSLNSTSDNNLRGFFSVNPETGTLSLALELDVDNIPTASDFLTVQITACDTDPPRDECPNLAVTIIVQSAADNDPMFADNQIPVVLREDTAIGSVIATSMCSDRDNLIGAYGGIELTNVIPSDAMNSFQINSTAEGNGYVILKEQLDFETTNSYNITLRCFDNQRTDPRETFAQVFIMVRPVNDQSPRFEKTFYTFAVNRISASGGDIGQVIASDNDIEVGGEIAYTFVSGDTSNFGLRLDGTVYLKDFVFAFEGDTFDLVVMASDGDFNATTKVIITVSGFLSIPEIVIILAIVSIVVIFITLMIVCACRCCRPVTSNKKGSTPSMSDLKFEKGEGRHQLEFVDHAYTTQPLHAVPVLYPVPPYEPVQTGPPQSVFQNWGVASQESPSESGIEDFDHSSIPQSNKMSPVLQEVVEHFKEGEKLISKNKNDSKNKSEV